MALSLEIKKFVNSEHVGKYAEIYLPIEAMPDRPEKKKKKPRKEEAEIEQVPEQESTVLEAQASDAPVILEGDVPYETQPQTPLVEPQVEAEPAFETVRIHYMEEGDGEPLVLVHSVGQSIYTWRSLFYNLAQNYRVIAVDLPGFGYSSRPEEYSYTIEEQSRTLEMFLDAIGIESAHFMAFSMGGAYLMDFCLRRPERVGRVVLLTPGGMTPEMPMPIKLLDSTIFGGIASILFGVRTVENVLSECFFDQTVGIKPDVIEEYYKTICDSASRRALRMSFHNFEDQTLVNRLRAAEMPVLVLLGAEDKWRSPAQIELFHAAIPEAGYSLIRNAGHLLHEEKPDKVLAAILEFIPVICPDME
ncbi:MAG: alpha/beta hydrolase [Clostridia bacterium]|nr:alpha/beta hydrolase [Clostridia bacterium]